MTSHFQPDPPADHERKVVMLSPHRPIVRPPDLFEQLREQHRKADLERMRKRDLDHDLRVIGYGGLAAYCAVIIFRLAQMGVL